MASEHPVGEKPVSDIHWFPLCTCIVCIYGGYSQGGQPAFNGGQVPAPLNETLVLLDLHLVYHVYLFKFQKLNLANY